MSRAARTVQIWGLYGLAIGLFAALFPNALAALLQFPSTDEPWLRLAGILPEGPVDLVIADAACRMARIPLD
jgi:hypothetical protein